MSKKGTDQFQIYHGTAPKATHEIVRAESELKDGICLNIFRGFAKIKKDFANAEDLGLQIFMDNGSFERFGLAFSKKTKPEKKIPLNVYFSENNAAKYFEYVTDEYKKLFEASTHPERLIITVPEVIASGPSTQKLQAKYLPTYKKLKEIYGFKIIVSMQFNPHDDKWATEMADSARFIAANININDRSGQRVGVPFGNDFKVIQNLERFNKVDDLFTQKGALEGHGAHLFAAGSPQKVLKFAKDWVDSVDSSTVNNWSKYAHYLDDNGKYIDIRDMQGRAKTKKGSPPSKETVKAIWARIRAEGVEPSLWMARGTIAQNWRYQVLLMKVDYIIAKTKGWKITKPRYPKAPKGIEQITDFPSAEYIDLHASNEEKKAKRS